jgi:NlpC/P60 family putative phage cell wall peptidase
MDEEIVRLARAWIGTPYRHQGSLKGVACDCLGLARGLWREVYGEEPEVLPAYSPDWAEASGEESLEEAAARHMILVARATAPEDILAQAEVGDLLLFRWRPHLPAKHCAILTEKDLERTPFGWRIIHAYDAAGKVAEVGLAPQWRKRVVAAYRFPGLGAPQEARSAAGATGTK